jgi:hypothetical protein
MSNKPEKNAAKAPKQIDFIVTTSNPKNDTNNKKRVRSVAALKSWPERRKKIFEQLESSAPGQGAFIINQPEPERQAKRVARKPAEQSSQARQSHSDVIPAPRVPPGFPDQPRHAPIVAVLETSSRDERPSESSARPTTKENHEDDDAPGSSITLYHRAAGYQPRAPLPSPDEHLTSTNTPCQCTHCQDARLAADGVKKAVYATQAPVSVAGPEHLPEVAPVRRKRMADGSEKEKDARYARDMALLTPPSSPGVGPGRGTGDPYNCYPVEYQPWYDQILHHSKFISG